MSVSKAHFKVFYFIQIYERPACLARQNSIFHMKRQSKFMEIRVSRSSIFILLFAAVILTSHLGVGKCALTCAAVALHELGHFCASVICGNRFKRLTLSPEGLRLSGSRAFSSYSDELLVALSGPFMNLVCALAFLGTKAPLAIYFRNLSLALAALNLLPVKSLDGGRAVYCLLARRLFPAHVHRICTALSFLAFFGIWCIAIYAVLKTGRNTGSLLFSMALFFKMLSPEN